MVRGSADRRPCRRDARASAVNRVLMARRGAPAPARFYAAAAMTTARATFIAFTERLSAMFRLFTMC